MDQLKELKESLYKIMKNADYNILVTTIQVAKQRLEEMNNEAN